MTSNRCRRRSATALSASPRGSKSEGSNSSSSHSPGSTSSRAIPETRSWVVLCHLWHLDWKQCGAGSSCPMAFLEIIGVGRGAKWRVLNKLDDEESIEHVEADGRNH